jgi:hypothetical protein
LAIGAYPGCTEVFDQALADFARADADQGEADHEARQHAIAAGDITAETGI